MVDVDVLEVVNGAGLLVVVGLDVVDLGQLLLVDEVGVGAGGSHCGA